MNTQFYLLSRLCCCLVLSLQASKSCFSQADSVLAKLGVSSSFAGGSVYLLTSENDDGGGNVAALIGPDGILLVDNMYKVVTPKVKAELKKISPADIRIVVNTHFHRDHIEGNTVLSHSSVIIAHENLYKRLSSRPGAQVAGMLPQIVFADSMHIYFNGEDIRLLHFPNGHTDNDVMVYFTGSAVIHMGDTYFNGMFPAVYKEGGGDVLQLIANLDKVITMLPENIKIIPGHGPLASKSELRYYINMLKETTLIVQKAIREGKTLDQLQKEKPLIKYDKLGSGGAQTTEQYTAMLYKLLS